MKRARERPGVPPYPPLSAIDLFVFMSLGAGERLGPYEILAPIGAGGMGEVYKARDTKLNREVAIKVLPQLLARDPERLARFEREAKVLASLNHPHIAHIYGVEESNAGRALVMELVPGQTLKGPLPLNEALYIAGQVAEALEAAHDKGIIHRDLKPANIMITPAGVVKVLDFGLAAVTPPGPASGGDPNNSPTLTMGATQAGMILGTAAYMSPEQARGKSVTPRADIWAFGVVLYEMLVGRQLFRGDDLTEVLASVVKDQPDLGATPREVQRLLKAMSGKGSEEAAAGNWRIGSLLLDAPPSRPARNRRQKFWPALAAILWRLSVGYVSFRSFSRNLPARRSDETFRDPASRGLNLHTHFCLAMGAACYSISSPRTRHHYISDGWMPRNFIRWREPRMRARHSGPPTDVSSLSSPMESSR